MKARVDENIKSVRFPKEADNRLALLASKLGRTKRLLVIQMVDYFYKSKKDPSDLNDELLKKELSSGISRILSFIRKQEVDLLVPIYSTVEELAALIKLQSTITQAISQGQLETGTSIKENAHYLKQVYALLRKVLEGVAEKQDLKTNFSKIIEYYIAERETLGWPVSSAKKDELAKKVRQALEKL